MTDIGKINVGQSYKPQENNVQEEMCPICEECHGDDAPVKEMNLNNAPAASLGQSMVKGPYKFDPKKVEADVLAFKGKVDSMRENGVFVKEFKKELEEEYKKSGMSREEAEHWADIAAQCLSNPVVYNR